MKHQELAFNVTGQTLFNDVLEGRPSAVASLQIWRADVDDTSSAEVAAGAASIETNPNTTTVGTIGVSQADPTRIDVAAITGFAYGRRYLITSTTQEREWFEVREIGATYVRAKLPLRNEYLVGSTVVSTRMSATIDATWIADLSNITEWEAGWPGYRCRWQYTVAGVVYVALTFFDVTRYPLRTIVTPLDVDGRYPGWIDRLPPDYREDGGASLVERAYEQVRMDALGRGHRNLRRFRNLEVVRELVTAKAMALSTEREILLGGGDPTRLRIAEDGYETKFNQLVLSEVTPDSTDGGAAITPTRAPIWVR